MKTLSLIITSLMMMITGSAGAQSIYTLDNVTNVYDETSRLIKTVPAAGTNPILDQQLNVYHAVNSVNSDGVLSFSIYKNGSYLRDAGIAQPAYIDTAGNCYSVFMDKKTYGITIYKNGIAFRNLQGSPNEKFGIVDNSGNIFTSVYNVADNSIKVKRNGSVIKIMNMPAGTKPLKIGAIFANDTIFLFYDDAASMTTIVYKNATVYKSIKWKSGAEKFGGVF